MSATPELGPVPQRVTVTAEQVQRLVAVQFPHWAGLDLRPVPRGGWDNWTFRLGPDLVVRLPSAAEYAQAVDKEHRWLPVLAPRLPLPVPTPLGRGVPSAEYPFAWSVYRWLDGETASVDRVADPGCFAAELAGFLVALQAVDTKGGPRPGVHNWYRGGTLRTFDADTRRAITVLGDRVDGPLVSRIWTTALDATWDGKDVWFHGDVAEGNLLLNDGRLAAVIDFGTCGIGDPACDVAIAWTLLTGDARQLFRRTMSADPATWARGRGWALWKALATCSYSLEPDEAADFDRARRVVDEICAEYGAD